MTPAPQATAAPLGIAGRLAATFQSAALTPLLALVGLLLGIFAVLVTPREEEPQIDVTMANVIVPFPGASVRDVEAMVATPGEHVLSRIAGVEHVMSVSRPQMAVLTVQFKVGVPRTEALVRLNDTLQAHADWLPQGLGVMQPLVKPKGIDDVPIVAYTLSSNRTDVGAFELERVAHSIETELKRVPGTRDVFTLGGPGRAILVELDPQRLAASGVPLQRIRQTLQAANLGLPIGELLQGNRSIELTAGELLRDARDVGGIVIGSHAGAPILLQDVANVRDGAPPATQIVRQGLRIAPAAGRAAASAPAVDLRPAVTLAITKKPGENAIDVANALGRRIDELRNTVIPADVQVDTTRNYGQTADDKARTLITKLLFATVSVVVLVFFALGRREAAIVGAAVVLTLTVTLFASWAWGFTLNRVSLFALIFSIGILVDDAIVVVENIHRHMALRPGRPLKEIIPGAVDEVGGPTILATFTVIAALLPMAFVSGLMGPYMAPIPINASMGMLLSLAIAFIVTPWLARLWMKAVPAPAAGEDPHGAPHVAGHGLARRLAPLFERLFAPLLDARRGGRARDLLWLGVAALIALSVALPVVGAVVLKMLPFDNKSEFQVIVDLPPGTPVERTAAVLAELGTQLSTHPEVKHWQAYAGTASPINFNGLVRQYDLRRSGELGDLQVTLVDKAERKDKSHVIAMRLRPELVKIGERLGARVKVVEVPPGPPVLSPIVAEIYGPDATGRQRLAAEVEQVFRRTPGVVDIDTSMPAPSERIELVIDRRKAALRGVAQAAVVDTLRATIGGEAVTYVHDASRIAVPAWLQLDPREQGRLQTVLDLQVAAADGRMVPLRELVEQRPGARETPIFHKDLLPVQLVVGDMAGTRAGDLDSPLYGMFKMRSAIAALTAPDGGKVEEFFIRPPSDPWRGYALKWDGEWQITYETFRDMGAAYAVGLVLIYLLVVAQFKSYLTPLIIMAPIPLTLIGVMPGHALLGAQFTATSMIGMIALAGIIVRNSILLVDFIELQIREGMPLERAIVQAAITRAQPIVLTGLAAMIGALFILDDPIFNGLAISLIFGILVSTVLTLVVIPTLVYLALRRHGHAAHPSPTPLEQAP